MTSRRRQRGNAAMGYIALLGALATAFLMTTLQQVRKQFKLTQKETFEAGMSVTSHGFANLVKELMLANYNAYLAKTANGWPACPTATPRGATDFIAILNNPTGQCAQVQFMLVPPAVATADQPDVSLRPVTSNATTLPLSALLGTALTPVKAVNGTEVTFTLTQIDTNRGNAIGTLNVKAGGERQIATAQNARQIIELPRTLNAPQGDPGCHMCLTVPGSVCCSGTVKLTYLESGTGRVMQRSWDRAKQAFLGPPTPYPADVPDLKAISVKNMASARTNYSSESFCLDGCPGNRTQYVVDAAISGARTYYLRSDGTVVTGASPTVAVFSDPRIQSIAYEDGAWYLLRGDGAVIIGPDIGNAASLREVPYLRIPSAQALAMGAGPPRS